MEIRYTEPNDIPDLTTILAQTDVLKQDVLGAPLHQFLDGDTEDLWLTCEQNGKAIAFCYAAPDQSVDGTWHMLGLAVLPEFQGKRLGTELAKQMEAELEEQSAQVLIADLAEAPANAGTFFVKAGYSEKTEGTLTYQKAIG